MDSKEKFLVDELCWRITQQTFHERDVLALLILLRERSTAKSPVRELADFIAHREKTLGKVKDYVHHVFAYSQAPANGTAAQLKIDPVFTASAFQDSLNSVLAGLSIPVFPNEIAEDVLACTMSLFQNVRIFHKKREIGRLGLARLAGDLWLYGSVIVEPKGVQVVFPALIVPNRYCAPGNAEHLGFSGLVEARCTKGKLRLYVGGREETLRRPSIASEEACMLPDQRQGQGLRRCVHQQGIHVPYGPRMRVRQRRTVTRFCRGRREQREIWQMNAFRGMELRPVRATPGHGVAVRARCTLPRQSSRHRNKADGMSHRIGRPDRHRRRWNAIACV